MANDATLSARLESTVDELDTTIRDIRKTIFELQSRGASSLRTELGALGGEYAAVLGFAPSVRTAGPVDTAVPDDVRTHLLAVAREALSNTARHAFATAVTIEVRADAREVTLTVGDDGVGLPSDRHESGLHNARRRAEQLGGSLALSTNHPRGTRLVWQVPVQPPSA